MTTTHQKIQFFDQKGRPLSDLTIECTTNGAHMDYLCEAKKILRQEGVRYLHDNSQATGQELIHSIHFLAYFSNEAFVGIEALAEMARYDDINSQKVLAVDTTNNSRQFVANTATASC